MQAAVLDCDILDRTATQAAVDRCAAELGGIGVLSRLHFNIVFVSWPFHSSFCR